MIKAIIFDCFGVLTTDGWLKFCDTYLKDEAKAAEGHRLNHLVDEGRIGYPEFLNLISELSGVDKAEVDRTIAEPIPKNTELLDYIKSLKPRFKMAILSNISNPDWFKEYFAADELAIFDEIIVSSREGIIKPDPRIFHIALDKLGVRPEEAVFIDDRQKNVDAAQQLGIKSFLYQNYAQCRDELEKLVTPVADN